MISLRQLASKMTLDIPVQFYTFDLRKLSMINFCAASKEEEIKYNSLSEEEKKLCYSDSFFIELPRMETTHLYTVDIYEAYELNANHILELSLNNIFTILGKDIDKPLAFCLNILLHEIGHYDHFKEMNFSLHMWATTDLDKYKEYYIVEQQLEKAIRHGKSKEIETLNKKCADMYRSIPKEKRADEFALSHLYDAYSKFA